MSDSHVETTAERHFMTLGFTPVTLQSFFDKAKRLFPDQSNVGYIIRASFKDKSGAFKSIEALLSQPSLPDVLYDIEPSLSSDDRRIWMHRFDKVILFVSSPDEVWSHGVAEVLGRFVSGIEVESRKGWTDKHPILALVVRDPVKSSAVPSSLDPLTHGSPAARETLIWHKRNFWVAVVSLVVLAGIGIAALHFSAH